MSNVNYLTASINKDVFIIMNTTQELQIGVKGLLYAFDDVYIYLKSSEKYDYYTHVIPHSRIDLIYDGDFYENSGQDKKEDSLTVLNFDGD